MALWMITGGKARADDFPWSFELSISGEREFGVEGVQPRGGFAVSYATVPNRLEIELEITVSAFDGGIAAPIEVHFKRPFRLSSRMDLKPGVGPSMTPVFGTDNNGVFAGGEIILEWKVALYEGLAAYVEPSYNFLFRKGVDQEIGMGTGLSYGF